MAKEKTAQELGEIMSDQLDKLQKRDVSVEARKTADAIANMIGKIQQQARLEISYAKDAKKPIPYLPSMSRAEPQTTRKR